MAINEHISQKMRNMSFVCSVLVVCHHFAVIGESGGGLWWFAKLMGQGPLGMGGGMTWIAVPWFFLASGYFLARHMDEKDWYCHEVQKRVHSLVIPFFFWCFAGIILLSMMDISQGRPLYYGTLKTVLKGCGAYPNSVVNPMASQLWYIRALIMLVIVSPIIFKFLGFWWLIGTFALYLVIAPFDGAVLHPFFRYGFSLEGLFYFSLGVYFCRRPVRISQQNLVLLGMLGGDY